MMSGLALPLKRRSRAPYHRSEIICSRVYSPHSVAPAADFSRLQRASITFRDVAKRYGDHQVLNAINLQVEPGEVVAILGPSDRENRR